VCIWSSDKKGPDERHVFESYPLVWLSLIIAVKSLNITPLQKHFYQNLFLYQQRYSEEIIEEKIMAWRQNLWKPRDQEKKGNYGH
jgi:hypothetical protein